MRPSELLVKFLWLPIVAGAVWFAQSLGYGWLASLALGVPAGLALVVGLAFVSQKLLG